MLYWTEHQTIGVGDPNHDELRTYEDLGVDGPDELHMVSHIRQLRKDYLRYQGTPRASTIGNVLHVYGRAVWAPWQLENELSRGAWKICPASIEDIFSVIKESPGSRRHASGSTNKRYADADRSEGDLYQRLHDRWREDWRFFIMAQHDKVEPHRSDRRDWDEV